MWRLIRFALSRWRSKQQSVIDRLPQAKSRWDIPAQIGDYNLLINDAVRSGPGAICRQRDVNNPIHESKCRSNFVENEGSVGNVTNLNYSPFRVARVGVVCHDGSCRFWEWDDAKACFVTLEL